MERINIYPDYSSEVGGCGSSDGCGYGAGSLLDENGCGDKYGRGYGSGYGDSGAYCGSGQEDCIGYGMGSMCGAEKGRSEPSHNTSMDGRCKDYDDSRIFLFLILRNRKMMQFSPGHT